MKIKFLSILVVVLLAVAMLPSFVAAENPVDLNVLYIKIDGEVHNVYNDVTENVLQVRRGETLPIRVRIAADSDVKDAQIVATISGYQYSQFETNKVLQQTKTFDLEAGREENVDMSLQIPVDMKNDATGAVPTKLRIFVTDRADLVKVFEYNLDVQGVEREHAVVIKEAYLNPSNEVLAGRALSALVKVENVGDYDLDDATLIVSVPKLHIQDTETLDSLDAGEKATFEETVLRFPASTIPGTYTIQYKVTFDNYYSVVKTDTVEVKADPCADGCAAKDNDKSFITVPSTQNIAGDSGAVYPIMINNAGKSAKSYMISVQGVDGWGTARVDPSASVIVQPGESQTVFLYVNANDDVQAGSKVFQLSIVSDNMSKQVPLTAVVSQGNTNVKEWDGLKKTLEIGLIILVIILILIGLVVGFNKLRGSGDDDDEDAKTYY